MRPEGSDISQRPERGAGAEAGLVIAAIAPHGGIVIEELCSPDQVGLAADTRTAMQEIGRRFAEARPETIVVLTPHNVSIQGAMVVVIGSAAAGAVAEGERRVMLRCPIDRELAESVLTSARLAGVPAVGVTLGPGMDEAAVMPMDWGTLVPLWFLGAQGDAPPAIVIVAPGPGLPADAHVRAGAAVARAAAASGRRVALVASADHGHAHTADGPYGFHPTSREYDQLVVRLVERDQLGGLLLLDPSLVERARADSFWQLLMLHGALAGRWRCELLSYEVPTYFGMLCAVYAP